MKLLVMTDEGRQKLRERQQQRESKRRPGLTLEEVLAAMTEIDDNYLFDVTDLHWQKVGGTKQELEYVDSFVKFLLAHIKEGK